MLRRGQRFTLRGVSFKVEYVNASRAHCVGKLPRTVTVCGHTFRGHRTITLDIAPTSGVEVLAELERGR